MKPCSNQRKRITLLALDELNFLEAKKLRLHLQACEGCRRYLEEISVVKESLSAGEAALDIATSESFHRKMLARLQAEEKVSLWESVKALPAVPGLRVALPVLAVFVALAVGLGMQHRQSTVAIPPPPHPNPMASTPAPTIANYQFAINQSMQAFDDLLNRQAKIPLPPAPVYTASMLTLASASD